MLLTIDTEKPISALDKSLIRTIIGDVFEAPESQTPAEQTPEEEPKPAPRKRAAKKTAAPKPDPEPEPEDETPADEPDEADEADAEPTKEDALTLAQKVMDDHEKAGITAVKDVLAGLGLKRVGEMKDTQAGEFIELLTKAAAELDEGVL